MFNHCFGERGSKSAFFFFYELIEQISNIMASAVAILDPMTSGQI